MIIMEKKKCLYIYIYNGLGVIVLRFSCWTKIYKDVEPFTPKHLQAIIRKFTHNNGKKKSKASSKNPCILF